MSVGERVVLEDAGSRVEIAPERGGLVTSFVVAGRELLYLERATLEDASKNVRGGIPVLFPSPGKLADDRFSYQGTQGALKQHGFARNLPWKVAGKQGASVTLTLEDSEATRAQFPWPFRYDLSVSLAAARLRLDIAVHNPGSEALPCGLGFHPYFQLDDKVHARIDTRTTRVFDNVSKREVPFEGFDFGKPEQDLYLLDHGSTHCTLHYGDGASLQVRGSADFERWVVWSLSSKTYVCIEPWTTMPDALNTGRDLLRIAPGHTHRAWVELELLE